MSTIQLSALKVQSIKKSFGGVCALNDVSFDVPERSIFGLIGPNGAGKTTLFNVITGFCEADHGQTYIGSTCTTRWPAWRIARSGVARTFQNIRVFVEMNVIDNVLVAGSFHLRTLERELRAKAEALLDLCGLSSYKGELAGALPYGHQRRLEIARALMLSPSIVLLDEPAAGMSSHEADVLTDQIRALRDTMKLTIVLVEHNMHVVMRACDIVHCLDHGESIASGTPEEIKKHPAVLDAYLGRDHTSELL